MTRVTNEWGGEERLTCRLDKFRSRMQHSGESLGVAERHSAARQPDQPLGFELLEHAGDALTRRAAQTCDFLMREPDVPQLGGACPNTRGKQDMENLVSYGVEYSAFEARE